MFLFWLGVNFVLFKNATFRLIISCWNQNISLLKFQQNPVLIREKNHLFQLNLTYIQHQLTNSFCQTKKCIFWAHQLNIFWALVSVEAGTLGPWCALCVLDYCRSLNIAAVSVLQLRIRLLRARCCRKTLRKIQVSALLLLLLLLLWDPGCCWLGQSTIKEKKMQGTKCTPLFLFIFNLKIHMPKTLFFFGMPTLHHFSSSCYT